MQSLRPQVALETHYSGLRLLTISEWAVAEGWGCSPARWVPCRTPSPRHSHLSLCPWHESTPVSAHPTGSTHPPIPALPPTNTVPTFPKSTRRALPPPTPRCKYCSAATPQLGSGRSAAADTASCQPGLPMGARMGGHRALGRESRKVASRHLPLCSRSAGCSQGAETAERP